MLGIFRNKEEKLSHAIKRNYIKKAQKQLGNGVDPNNTFVDNFPSIIYAAMHSMSEIIKLLIEHGADVNCKEKNNTALIYSAVNGSYEIAKLLIENGASVKSKNNKGYSAILEAGRNDNLNILQLLLDNMVNINDRNHKGWSTLHFFCFNNNKDAILILLKHQADVNIQNREMWTPLMFAVNNENLIITSLLLEYKADVELINNEGHTALQIAILNRNDKLAELLLKSGADFYHRDKETDKLIIDIAFHSKNIILKELAIKHFDKAKQAIENDNTDFVITIFKRSGGSEFIRRMKTELLLHALKSDRKNWIDFFVESSGLEAINTSQKRMEVFDTAVEKRNMVIAKQMIDRFQKIHSYAIRIAKEKNLDELQEYINIKKQKQLQKKKEKELRIELRRKEYLEKNSYNDNNYLQSDNRMILVLKDICKAYAENNEYWYKNLEPKARKIGEKLFETGGLREMRRIFSVVEGTRGSRSLEMHWNGIGNGTWRA